MSDVNANIHISIDSAGAYAELKRLQSEINSFNKSLAKANASAAAQAASLNRALKDGINATGMFEAKVVPTISSVERFSTALEKNKLTLGEYTKYAASQLPGLSRVFRKEWDTMENVATSRVKKINSQYVTLGKNAKGIQEALQITPTGLAKGYTTDIAIAAQKQQIFNKLIDDGSTKMLNWGKNTQWAGRQLMVGFSIPLAALGTIAAKTFMELDKASTAFERVYGDLSTTTAEMEKNKDAVQSLGQEYTKYGIAVKDTIELSARVAATGLTNEDMLAATEQTLRFATLGQMDYNQALDATISLQSAFGISSKDLAENIDYLNAVENQTVLTIQDMAAAIPRVAPVIKGLGGDIRDLAVMMTAMKEGGVTAENAANALKSGLASLINPTNRAQESMAKLGIDLQSIIDTNKGDLLATIQAFGQALSKLSEFKQQQALEQIFGKYQYARMGALFKNIINDSSQASRAMDLAGMSAEQLGQISQKELSAIAESTTVKFEAAMEKLKLAIAPLGEAFLKGVMPIMEFLTKVADMFNGLPDPIKNAVAVITGVVAGLGPVFLMTIGLIGNGFANLVKGIQFFRKRLAGIKGDASAFEYFAMAELEAKGASEALEGSVQSLTGSLLLQRGAVKSLISEYGRYAAAAGAAAGAAGAAAGGARGTMRPPIRRAKGGIVPGKGNKDSVPALLTPGETVITKEASQRYAPVIAAMNAGNLPGFNGGLNPQSQSYSLYGGQERMLAPYTMLAPGNLASGGFGMDRAFVYMEEFEQSFKMSAIAAAAVEGDIRLTEAKVGDLSDGLAKYTSKIVAEIRDVAEDSSHISDAFSRARPKVDAILAEMEAAGGEAAAAARGIRKMAYPSDQDIVSGGYARVPGVTVGGSGNISNETWYTNRSGSARSFENRLGTVQRYMPLAETGLGRYTKAHVVPESRSLPGRISGLAGRALSLPAAALTSARRSIFSRGQSYAQAAGATTGQAQIVEAQRVLGINSPAKEGEKLSQSVAEGQLVGAKKSAPTSAKAGKVAAQSQVSAMKKEIVKLQQTGAMSTTPIATPQLISANAKLLAAKEAAAIADQRGAALENKINVEKTQTIQAEKKRSMAARAAAAIGGKAGRIGMGLGMASMIPFMAQNEEGKFMGMDANALGMGMAGAGMAAEILPSVLPLIVSNPIIAVAAAAAAVTAASLYAWRKIVDNNAKKSAELGAAMGGTANSLNIMSKVLGKTTPAEARTKATLGVKQEDQQQFDEMASLLQGEAGQKMIADLKTKTTSERVTALTDYITNAIAAGLMNNKAGELFAKAAGVALSDAVTGAAVAANIKGAKTGSDALMALAEKRVSAVGKNAAIAEVKAAPKTGAYGYQKSIGTDVASFAIGGALQIIQDYSNVIQKAKDEYANGQISYEKYIDTLNRATDAQQEYETILRKSVANAVDQQGARQALDAQLIAGGMTQEQVDALTHATDIGTSEGPWNLFGQGSQSAYQSDYIARVAKSRFGKTDSQLTREERTALRQEASQAQQSAKAMFEGGLNEDLKMLVAEGKMAVDEAIALGQQMMNDSLSAAAKQYQRQQKAGKGTLGLEQAVFMSNIQNDVISGLNQGLKDQVIKIGLSFSDKGGNPVDLMNLLSNTTEKKRIDLIATLSGLSQEQLDWIIAQSPNGVVKPGTEWAAKEMAKQTKNAKTNNVALPSAVERTYTVGQTEGIFGQSGTTYSSLSMDKQEANRAGAQRDVQGIQDTTESIQKSGERINYLRDQLDELVGTDVAIGIDTALKFNGTPEDVSRYTAELASVINQIKIVKETLPENYQVMFGIDFSVPETFMNLTQEDINNLSQIGPIIDSLPEGKKELALSAVYDENGKPKDPIQFAKDYKSMAKITQGLKSEKKEVRKKTVIRLMVEVADQNGDTISPEKAQNYLDGMLKDLGISEEEFLKLPSDTIEKLTTISYKIGADKESLKQALAKRKYLISVGASTGEIEQINETIDALRVAIASGISEAKGVTSEGIIRSEDNNTKQTGGGGPKGTTSNPFKDFQKMILNQVKQYTDMGASMKTLLGKKYGFLNILKTNKGVDDKIRQLGLPSGLSEYLMSLPPEEAQKVFSKITGPKNNLNKVGRQLVNRYTATNISSRRTDAQQRLTQTQNQQAALASLQGRANVTTEAVSMIAGSPAMAEEYIYLVNEAKRKEIEWKKATSKGRKEAKKEWDDAKKAINGYLSDIVKADRAERAMAKRLEMTTAIKERPVTQSLVSQAASAGMSTEVQDALATGEYTALYQDNQTQLAAAQKDLDEKEKALAKAKKKRNREEIADAKKNLKDSKLIYDEKKLQVSNFFNFVKEYIASENEKIDPVQLRVDVLEAQDQLNSLLRQRDELIKIKPIQDEINKLQESNDVISRSIELKNREIEIIDEKIAKYEEEKQKINDTYEERIKALDLIEKANQRIYEQQRGQLSIAQALSSGDVAGAAKAMQDLQIQMAQDRQQSTRDSLELARNHQIEEIDKNINSLKDERKVTEGEIKDLQKQQRANSDAIYTKQLQINKINKELDKTYSNQAAALEIINGKIALQQKMVNDIVNKWNSIGGGALPGVAGTGTSPAASGAVPNTSGNSNSQDGQIYYNQIEWKNNKVYMKGTDTLVNGWVYDTNLKRKRLAMDGNWISGWNAMNTGGMVRYASGGSVFGSGGRDSVPTMLTPGEFVMRKSVVDKFGPAMFKSLNIGAMPRFNMPSAANYGLNNAAENANSNSAVYNYDISVNVDGTSSTADDIANVVLNKIKMIEDRKIRSNRY